VSNGEHWVVVEQARIRTPRVTLREWARDDAAAALAVYGAEDVTRWLSPAMGRVVDVASMERVIEGWLADDLEAPARRWAVEVIDEVSGAPTVIGGAALLPLPPDGVDLEIGWQLDPSRWGQGLGAEAGHAIAHYAFESGLDELFAVVRPNNVRGGATARRIGMEWVGETEKYYQLRLQVYRLRAGELDVPPVLPIDV
jgi:RimJ/RimL family protein N-acetyltransferase